MTESRVRRRAILAALLLALAPVAASAHAILIDSQPAVGGTASSGALDIRLRYNSRVDKGRSRLTLTKPDHTQAVLPIDDNGPADIMTTHVDLGPGAYSLRWQVLAIDGHITRGNVPFTLGPATAAQASAVK